MQSVFFNLKVFSLLFSSLFHSHKLAIDSTHIRMHTYTDADVHALWEHIGSTEPDVFDYFTYSLRLRLNLICSFLLNLNGLRPHNFSFNSGCASAGL